MKQIAALILITNLLSFLAADEAGEQKDFIRKVTFTHEESERDFFIEKRPAYACLKVGTPPVIDGRLEDPCWKTLPRLTEFYSGDGKGLTSRKTIGWFGHDDTNLYIAAQCLEPDPDSMRMTINEPGGQVWIAALM